MKFFSNSLVFSCVLIIFSTIFLNSCKNNDKLPILGYKETKTQWKDGKEQIDTIYHTIPAFSFVNQDNKTVTDKDFKDKIYVVDFFFTSCPTICPKMKQQLLRVYEKFEQQNNVLILSHSIDTKNDTVAVLKDYATRLKVKSPKWQFVIGKKEDIYKMAQQYLAAAQEDKEAEGGYTHSGYLALIDSQKRIRGLYDGTKPENVDKLLLDIENLSNEKK
jgi:protein SCO1